MRALAFLLLLFVAAACVTAAGGASSSSNAVEPYRGKYQLGTPRYPDVDKFVPRLKDHFRNNFELHDFGVTKLPYHHLTKEQLLRDLNSDKNARKFVYLGPYEREEPNMMLAVPLSSQAPTQDGSIPWALLKVEQPSRIVHHGFLSVRGRHVMTKLDEARPYGPYLEAGRVMTIEDVFNELPFLRSSSWDSDDSPLHDLAAHH